MNGTGADGDWVGASIGVGLLLCWIWLVRLSGNLPQNSTARKNKRRTSKHGPGHHQSDSEEADQFSEDSLASENTSSHPSSRPSSGSRKRRRPTPKPLPEGLVKRKLSGQQHQQQLLSSEEYATSENDGSVYSEDSLTGSKQTSRRGTFHDVIRDIEKSINETKENIDEDEENVTDNTGLTRGIFHTGNPRSGSRSENEVFSSPVDGYHLLSSSVDVEKTESVPADNVDSLSNSVIEGGQNSQIPNMDRTGKLGYALSSEPIWTRGIAAHGGEDANVDMDVEGAQRNNSSANPVSDECSDERVWNLSIRPAEIWNNASYLPFNEDGSSGNGEEDSYDEDDSILKGKEARDMSSKQSQQEMLTNLHREYGLLDDNEESDRKDNFDVDENMKQPVQEIFSQCSDTPQFMDPQRAPSQPHHLHPKRLKSDSDSGDYLDSSDVDSQVKTYTDSVDMPHKPARKSENALNAVENTKYGDDTSQAQIDSRESLTHLMAPRGRTDSGMSGYNPDISLDYLNASWSSGLSANSPTIAASSGHYSLNSDDQNMTQESLNEVYYSPNQTAASVESSSSYRTLNASSVSSAEFKTPQQSPRQWESSLSPVYSPRMPGNSSSQNKTRHKLTSSNGHTVEGEEQTSSFDIHNETVRQALKKEVKKTIARIQRHVRSLSDSAISSDFTESESTSVSPRCSYFKGGFAGHAVPQELYVAHAEQIVSQMPALLSPASEAKEAKYDPISQQYSLQDNSSSVDGAQYETSNKSELGNGVSNDSLSGRQRKGRPAGSVDELEANMKTLVDEVGELRDLSPQELQELIRQIKESIDLSDDLFPLPIPVGRFPEKLVDAILAIRHYSSFLKPSQRQRKKRMLGRLSQSLDDLHQLKRDVKMKDLEDSISHRAALILKRFDSQNEAPLGVEELLNISQDLEGLFHSAPEVILRDALQNNVAPLDYENDIQEEQQIDPGFQSSVNKSLENTPMSRIETSVDGEDIKTSMRNTSVFNKAAEEQIRRLLLARSQLSAKHSFEDLRLSGPKSMLNERRKNYCQLRMVRQKCASESDIPKKLKMLDQRMKEEALKSNKSMKSVNCADDIRKYLDNTNDTDDSICFVFLDNYGSAYVSPRMYEEPTGDLDLHLPLHSRSADSVYTNSDYDPHLSYRLYQDPMPPLFDRAASLDDISHQRVLNSQWDSLPKFKSADFVNPNDAEADDSSEQIFPPRLHIQEEMDVSGVIDDKQTEDDNELRPSLAIHRNSSSISLASQISSVGFHYRKPSYPRYFQGFEEEAKNQLEQYVQDHSIESNMESPRGSESSEYSSDSYFKGEVESGMPYFREFKPGLQPMQSENSCQTDHAIASSSIGTDTSLSSVDIQRIHPIHSTQDTSLSYDDQALSHSLSHKFEPSEGTQNWQQISDLMKETTSMLQNIQTQQPVISPVDLDISDDSETATVNGHTLSSRGVSPRKKINKQGETVSTQTDNEVVDLCDLTCNTNDSGMSFDSGSVKLSPELQKKVLEEYLQSQRERSLRERSLSEDYQETQDPLPGTVEKMYYTQSEEGSSSPLSGSHGEKVPTATGPDAHHADMTMLHGNVDEVDARPLDSRLILVFDGPNVLSSATMTDPAIKVQHARSEIGVQADSANSTARNDRIVIKVKDDMTQTGSSLENISSEGVQTESVESVDRSSDVSWLGDGKSCSTQTPKRVLSVTSSGIQTPDFELVNSGQLHMSDQSTTTQVGGHVVHESTRDILDAQDECNGRQSRMAHYEELTVYQGNTLPISETFDSHISPVVEMEPMEATFATANRSSLPSTETRADIPGRMGDEHTMSNNERIDIDPHHTCNRLDGDVSEETFETESMVLPESQISHTHKIQNLDRENKESGNVKQNTPISQLDAEIKLPNQSEIQNVDADVSGDKVDKIPDTNTMIAYSEAQDKQLPKANGDSSEEETIITETTRIPMSQLDEIMGKQKESEDPGVSEGVEYRVINKNVTFENDSTPVFDQQQDLQRSDAGGNKKAKGDEEDELKRSAGRSESMSENDNVQEDEKNMPGCDDERVKQHEAIAGRTVIPRDFDERAAKAEVNMYSKNNESSNIDEDDNVDETSHGRENALEKFDVYSLPQHHSRQDEIGGICVELEVGGRAGDEAKMMAVCKREQISRQDFDSSSHSQENDETRIGPNGITREGDKDEKMQSNDSNILPERPDISTPDQRAHNTPSDGGEELEKINDVDGHVLIVSATNKDECNTSGESYHSCDETLILETPEIHEGRRATCGVHESDEMVCVETTDLQCQPPSVENVHIDKDQAINNGDAVETTDLPCQHPNVDNVHIDKDQAIDNVDAVYHRLPKNQEYMNYDEDVAFVDASENQSSTPGVTNFSTGKANDDRHNVHNDDAIYGPKDKRQPSTDEEMVSIETVVFHSQNPDQNTVVGKEGKSTNEVDIRDDGHHLSDEEMITAEAIEQHYALPPKSNASIPHDKSVVVSCRQDKLPTQQTPYLDTDDNTCIGKTSKAQSSEILKDDLKPRMEESVHSDRVRNDVSEDTRKSGIRNTTSSKDATEWQASLPETKTVPKIEVERGTHGMDNCAREDYITPVSDEEMVMEEISDSKSEILMSQHKEKNLDDIANDVSRHVDYANSGEEIVSVSTIDHQKLENCAQKDHSMITEETCKVKSEVPREDHVTNEEEAVHSDSVKYDVLEDAQYSGIKSTTSSKDATEWQSSSPDTKHVPKTEGESGSREICADKKLRGNEIMCELEKDKDSLPKRSSDEREEHITTNNATSLTMPESDDETVETLLENSSDQSRNGHDEKPHVSNASETPPTHSQMYGHPDHISPLSVSLGRKDGMQARKSPQLDITDDAYDTEASTSENFEITSSGIETSTENTDEIPFIVHSSSVDPIPSATENVPTSYDEKDYSSKSRNETETQERLFPGENVKFVESSLDETSPEHHVATEKAISKTYQEDINLQQDFNEEGSAIETFEMPSTDQSLSDTHSPHPKNRSRQKCLNTDDDKLVMNVTDGSFSSDSEQLTIHADELLKYDVEKGALPTADTSNEASGLYTNDVLDEARSDTERILNQALFQDVRDDVTGQVVRKPSSSSEEEINIVEVFQVPLDLIYNSNNVENSTTDQRRSISNEIEKYNVSNMDEDENTELSIHETSVRSYQEQPMASESMTPHMQDPSLFINKDAQLGNKKRMEQSDVDGGHSIESSNRINPDNNNNSIKPCVVQKHETEIIVKDQQLLVRNEPIGQFDSQDAASFGGVVLLQSDNQDVSTIGELEESSDSQRKQQEEDIKLEDIQINDISAHVPIESDASFSIPGVEHSITTIRTENITSSYPLEERKHIHDEKLEDSGRYARVDVGNRLKCQEGESTLYTPDQSLHQDFIEFDSGIDSQSFSRDFTQTPPPREYVLSQYSPAAYQKQMSNSDDNKNKQQQTREEQRQQKMNPQSPGNTSYNSSLHEEDGDMTPRGGDSSRSQGDGDDSHDGRKSEKNRNQSTKPKRSVDKKSRSSDDLRRANRLCREKQQPREVPSEWQLGDYAFNLVERRMYPSVERQSGEFDERPKLRMASPSPSRGRSKKRDRGRGRNRIYSWNPGSVSSLPDVFDESEVGSVASEDRRHLYLPLASALSLQSLPNLYRSTPLGSPNSPALPRDGISPLTSPRGFALQRERFYPSPIPRLNFDDSLDGKSTDASVAPTSPNTDSADGETQKEILTLQEAQHSPTQANTATIYNPINDEFKLNEEDISQSQDVSPLSVTSSSVKSEDVDTNSFSSESSDFEPRNKTRKKRRNRYQSTLSVPLKSQTSTEEDEMFVSPDISQHRISDTSLRRHDRIPEGQCLDETISQESLQSYTIPSVSETQSVSQSRPSDEMSTQRYSQEIVMQPSLHRFPAVLPLSNTAPSKAEQVSSGISINDSANQLEQHSYVQQECSVPSQNTGPHDRERHLTNTSNSLNESSSVDKLSSNSDHADEENSPSSDRKSPTQLSSSSDEEVVIIDETFKVSLAGDLEMHNYETVSGVESEMQTQLKADAESVEMNSDRSEKDERVDFPTLSASDIHTPYFIPDEENNGHMSEDEPDASVRRPYPNKQKELSKGAIPKKSLPDNLAPVRSREPSFAQGGRGHETHKENTELLGLEGIVYDSGVFSDRSTGQDGHTSLEGIDEDPHNQVEQDVLSHQIPVTIDSDQHTEYINPINVQQLPQHMEMAVNYEMPRITSTNSETVENVSVTPTLSPPFNTMNYAIIERQIGGQTESNLADSGETTPRADSDLHMDSQSLQSQQTPRADSNIRVDSQSLQSHQTPTADSDIHVDSQMLQSQQRADSDSHVDSQSLQSQQTPRTYSDTHVDSQSLQSHQTPRADSDTHMDPQSLQFRQISGTISDSESLQLSNAQRFARERTNANGVAQSLVEDQIIGSCDSIQHHFKLPISSRPECRSFEMQEIIEERPVERQLEQVDDKDDYSQLPSVEDFDQHISPDRHEHRTITMHENVRERSLEKIDDQSNRASNKDQDSEPDDFDYQSLRSRPERVSFEMQENVDERGQEIGNEIPELYPRTKTDYSSQNDNEVSLSNTQLKSSPEISEARINAINSTGSPQKQFHIPQRSRPEYCSFEIQEYNEQRPIECEIEQADVVSANNQMPIMDSSVQQQPSSSFRSSAEYRTIEINANMEERPSEKSSDQSEGINTKDLECESDSFVYRSMRSRPECVSFEMQENVEERGHEFEKETSESYLQHPRMETDYSSRSDGQERTANIQDEAYSGTRSNTVDINDPIKQQFKIPLRSRPECRSIEMQENIEERPSTTPLRLASSRDQNSINYVVHRSDVTNMNTNSDQSAQLLQESNQGPSTGEAQALVTSEIVDRKRRIDSVLNCMQLVLDLRKIESSNDKPNYGLTSENEQHSLDYINEPNIVPDANHRICVIPEMREPNSRYISYDLEMGDQQHSQSIAKDTDNVYLEDEKQPTPSLIIDQNIAENVPEPSDNRLSVTAHSFDSSLAERIHILPNSPQKVTPASSVSTETSSNTHTPQNPGGVGNPRAFEVALSNPDSEQSNKIESDITVRLGTPSSHDYPDETKFYDVGQVRKSQSPRQQSISSGQNAEQAMDIAMSASENNPQMRENLSMVSIMAQTPANESPQRRQRSYRNRDRMLNATISDAPFLHYSEIKPDVTISTIRNPSISQTRDRLSYVSSVSSSDRLITMSDTVVPSARYLSTSSNNLLSVTRNDQPFLERSPQSDCLVYPFPRRSSPARNAPQEISARSSEGMEIIDPTIQTYLKNNPVTLSQTETNENASCHTITEDIDQDEDQRHRDILALAQEVSKANNRVSDADEDSDRDYVPNEINTDESSDMIVPHVTAPVASMPDSPKFKDSESQTTDGEGEISYRREESIVESRDVIHPTAKVESGPILILRPPASQIAGTLRAKEDHETSAFDIVSSPSTDTFSSISIAPTMSVQSSAPETASTHSDLKFQREDIRITNASPPDSIDGRERSPLTRRRDMQNVDDSNIQNEIEKLKKEHDKMMDLLKRSREKKADLRKDLQKKKSIDSDSSSGDSPITVISKNGTPSVADVDSPTIGDSESPEKEIVSEVCMPEESIFHDTNVRMLDQSEITTQVDFPIQGRQLNRSQESQTDSSFDSHIEELLLKVPECAAFSMPPTTTNFDHRDGVFKPTPKVIETIFTEDRAIGSDSPINSYDERTMELIRVSSQTISGVSSRESSGDRSMVSKGSNVSFVDDEVESLLSRSNNTSAFQRQMVSTGTEVSVDSSDEFTQTDTMDDSIIHAITLGSLYSSNGSHDVSKIQQELERLNQERIEIIELLGLKYLPSSLTIELLEQKLNYCIGQTDLLLETLEDFWGREDIHTNKSTKLLNITKQYIEEYRSQFNRTTKDITSCLETHQRRKQGARGRRQTRGRDITMMKRRAEVEAFKLERLREECRYERQKAKDKSYSPSSSRTNTSYSSLGDSIDNMTPSQRKDYLINLRRQLVSNSAHEMSELRRVSMSPRPGSAHSADDYWAHRPSSYSPARSESPSTSYSTTIRRADFDTSYNSLYSMSPSMKFEDVPRPHSALPVVNMERDLRSNVIATFTTQDLSIDDLLEESNKIRQQNQMQISQAQEALKELDRKRKQHPSDNKAHGVRFHPSSYSKRDTSFDLSKSGSHSVGHDTSWTATDYRMRMFSRDLSPAQTSSPRTPSNFAAQARDHLARSQRLINSLDERTSSYSPSSRNSSSLNTTHPSHYISTNYSQTPAAPAYRSTIYSSHSSTIPKGRVISRHTPSYRDTSRIGSTSATTFTHQTPSPYRHHHHLSQSPIRSRSASLVSSGFHSRISHSTPSSVTSPQHVQGLTPSSYDRYESAIGNRSRSNPSSSRMSTYTSAPPHLSSLSPLSTRMRTSSLLRDSDSRNSDRPIHPASSFMGTPETDRSRSDTPLSACSLELDSILFSTTVSDGARVDEDLLVIRSRPISAQDIKASILEKKRKGAPN